MTGSHDIAVLGSGPAALHLAAEAAERGARIAIVAPSPRRAWPANYCLWEDELPERFTPLVERRWSEAKVAASEGEQLLQRSYVKLDTGALQRSLWTRLEGQNVHVIDGYAENLKHPGGHSEVRTDSGATHRAGVIVDASGARSRFTRRVHGRAPAFQTALGFRLRAPGHPFDRDRAVLMDFRPADTSIGDLPSFLYVLPLGPDELFIEETVLARRPQVGLERLEARLLARLRTYGLETAERIEEEHCSIAMGLGLPSPGQSIVPFGAAASMVHPASGYLQARVFRQAPTLAEALLEGLSHSTPGAAADLGNEAVWTRQARTCWELYAVGLELLVHMNTDETARFFGAFFQLPQESWSGFLAGTLSPGNLTRVMTHLLRLLPNSLRWRLIQSSVTRGAAPLARSMIPARVA